MLKIGDFSTLSRISIHMLRHYNEIGLLIPHHIDGFIGYRYYSEEQLPAANRIQALKDMGLSLAMQKQLLLLETTIKNLDKGSSLTNNSITLKEIPKRNVVSFRETIPSYDHEGTLWRSLAIETASQNIHPWL